MRFFLILIMFLNSFSYAKELNNYANGDWYSRNGIVCDNNINFCTPVPSDAPYIYKVTLTGCTQIGTCPATTRYLWYVKPDIHSNPFNKIILNYLSEKFSKGITDFPSARFLKLGDCASNNNKEGVNCSIILYYYDKQNQYQTIVIAASQSPIGSFPTYNNLSCPGINLNGLCINKDANEKGVKNLLKGDPINLNGKEVVDGKVDLKFPISIGRIYSSNSRDNGKFGISWTSDIDKKVRIPILKNPSNGISFSYSSYTSYTSQDGTTQFLPPNLKNTTWIQVQGGVENDLFFIRNNSNDIWKPAFNNYEGYKLESSNSNIILTKPNGDIINYDEKTGYIISEKFKNGSYLNYYYTGNQLTKIMNNFGQWIGFTYSNYADVITQITASNGDTVQYGYTNGYLTQATYNGTENYTYVYNNNGLIIDKYDENNQHYTHYDYDSQNRPIVNYMFDKEGNQINRSDINYSNNSYIAETKQNGNIIYHYFDSYNSSLQYTGSLNISGGNGYYTMTNKYYDSNGNLTYNYNALGAYAKYTYDTNNLITSIKKENGGIINFTWDTSKRLLLTMKEQTSNGNRITNYTYDDNNNINSKIIQGNNETLTWLYNWSSDGRLLSKTEPNGLMSMYDYYPIDGSSSSGLVKSISTSTGKVIKINSYDIRGNATSITGIDGNTKTMTYDIRNRLITETINNATNYYTYDLAGNLILVTFANGYQLTMTYDPSHRLTKIEDNLGGKEDFILDATTGEILNDSKYQNGVLIKTLNKVLDNAGNTIKIYKSNSAKGYNFGTLYNDGSISRGQDINNKNIIRNIYDTGNVQNYSYAGDTISYTYDYDDKIKTITANSQTTTYNYDDFGRLTQLISPDTGTQIMSYDTINGVKNRVDANNITHKITSDIEGKIITISHTNNNGTLTEGFEYYSDNKLNKITDSTGSTSFNYDNYGHLNQKTQTINGKDFKVYYEINNLGQLKSMTYPSGMIVHYDYNKGFLNNIYVNGTDIVKNVTYNSLEKEATSWILGSNTVTITKNADGDMTSFVDNGVLNESLKVDAMSQVNAVSDSVNGNNNISANYTDSYAIANWSNNNGTQSHNSGVNSNISSISGNGSNYSWNYIFGTNKISNYNYDNNGNVIADNKGNYVYDLKNNMISATRNNVTGNYYYNTLNQRVIKSVNGQTRYFVYNESNQLIGEYDANGNIITEYIYFGLRPVAIKTNGSIYMVHTDYLGTPRYIMDNASNMLWKWERKDPYGNNVAQGNIEFNLRFSGQYYDTESGLSYNINRMYDGDAKRYMQSDPMGLIAGWNTYNYVGRNPLNNVDPLGLSLIDMLHAQDSSSIPNWIQGSMNNWEALFKTIGVSNSNVINILSHGNAESINHTKPEVMAMEIISGYYDVGNRNEDNFKNGTFTDEIIFDNTFKNNLLHGKNIHIVLDACDTGTGSGYADNLYKILRKYLNDNGYKNTKLQIDAPTVSVNWQPWNIFRNPFNPLNDNLDKNGRWNTIGEKFE